MNETMLALLGFVTIITVIVLLLKNVTVPSLAFISVATASSAVLVLTGTFSLQEITDHRCFGSTTYTDVRYRLLLLRIDASPYRNRRKLRCTSGTYRHRYGSLPQLCNIYQSGCTGNLPWYRSCRGRDQGSYQKLLLLDLGCQHRLSPRGTSSGSHKDLTAAD